jgi:transcriptional regulator with XRE-family HTH domain
VANLISQQIVDLLVAERTRQGLSQAEIARRMGAATSWVQHIEYNKQSGRQVSALQRYADALNLDLEVSIVREDRESSEHGEHGSNGGPLQAG